MNTLCYKNYLKSIISRIFMVCLVNGFGLANAQTSFTSTSVSTAWNAARWNNASDAAPYTDAFTSNNAVSFTSGTYTINGMGADISVGNVSLATGVIANFNANSGTFTPNGVITITTNGTSRLNFLTQTFSTTTGTGIIKEGAGSMRIGAQIAGTLPSGITLNAGALLLPNSVGTINSGVFTWNGGVLSCIGVLINGPDFTPSSTVIGGDVQFGATSTEFPDITGTSDGRLDIYLKSPTVNYGSANRIITVGNGGHLRINGLISGTGNLTFNENAGLTGIGAIRIENNSNNFTGDIFINDGADVWFSTDGSMGTSTNDVTIDGGLFSSFNVISTFNVNRTFSLGDNAGTGFYIFGQAITIAGVVQNKSGETGILNKTGPGPLTLTNQCLYTGLTTVSDGTLRLNRSGGTTIPATNNVTINGGTLQVSTNQTLNNLTISSGGLTIDAGVTLTINGTLTYTGGTINYNSTGNLVISNSGTLVASAGTFTTGGRLTIQSNASGTGRIGNSAGTISGIVNVERYIPAGKRAYRLISHPFANSIKLNQLMDDIHITGATGAVAGFDATTLNNPSAFSFAESGFVGTSNSGWTAFTNASSGGNDVNANSPIRVLYRGPRSQSNLLDGSNPSPLEGTLDWTNTSGNINQGTVNVAMSFTGANGGNAGWNLLPNPYPSNYDLGSTASGNRNSISTFNVWVPTNGTRGAYASASFGSAYVIPSGGAFFVKTTSATNFVFSESQKTASAPSAALLKTDPFKVNALQIDVTSDAIYWDKIELRNRDFGTVNRDLEDGPKMENPDVNFFTYTPANDKLAIDNRTLTNGSIVPLGFEVSSDYNFTFKVSNIDLNEFDVQLVDNYLSKTISLSQNVEYKFETNADAKSKGLNRFELVFNNATGLTDLQTSHFSLYPNPALECIHLSLITNLKGEYNYEIYNQLGAQIKAGSLDFNANRAQSIGVEEMSNGVYFIKVYNATATQTIKFIK